MQRDREVVLVAGLILLAVAVAGFGLFRTTATTTLSGEWREFPEPPEDGSFGIVFDLRLHEGRRLFGLRLEGSTPEAHIALVVPSGCIEADAAGVETLSNRGACTDLPVRGELSGGGITAGGKRLAMIRLTLQEDCYRVLTVGDAWPSAAPECGGS